MAVLSEDGILLGMEVSGAGPVLWHRFSPDAMNPHQVLLSGDSSETSLHGALMVLREAARGVGCYIVDTRGRCGGLAGSMGGRVLELGAGGPGLNPFAIRYTGNRHDVALRVSGLCSLVDAMSGDDHGLERRALVDDCLTGFYTAEVLDGDGPGLLGLSGFPGFLRYLESPEARARGGP